MKNIIRISGIILSILLIYSCNKEEIPTLTTSEITGTTETSAISGGTITDEGSAAITSRGVCWSIEQNPTISSPHTSDGSGTGNFTSVISGLTPNTNYNVRAYATNSCGTGYGTTLLFKTSPLTVPNLTTKPVSSITNSSAISGGEIRSEGGSQITAKGICWSITRNPTISNSMTNDGTGKDSFSSAMTGLQNSTTYYVKAYATNSFGTAYGNELSFKTAPVKAELSTTEVSGITSTTAISGGIITNDGGGSVTKRGVIYSTNPNPVIYYPPDYFETSDGTGVGPFVSNISKLYPNTTYYVRAYASNSAGIALGDILSFTTLMGIPVIITTNISFLADGTIISGGFIAHDGGSSISSRGICWSINPDPTILDNLTSDGSDTGLYTSILTGLQNGITYYVRAYATNGQGTGYGQQIVIQNISLPLSVIDADGNAYSVIKIGEQYWLGENLKGTKYNDGTQIPLVQDNSAWQNLTTGAYCWYNNNVQTGNNFGALYNYYTVSTNKICPSGWHVPSSSEWSTLKNYLLDNGYGLEANVNYVAKSVSSTLYWESSGNQYTPGYQSEKNNVSGFSGTPGGGRLSIGSFHNNGKYSLWWTSSLYNNDVWLTTLYYTSSGLTVGGTTGGNFATKKEGNSIRCIKDN